MSDQGERVETAGEAGGHEKSAKLSRTVKVLGLVSLFTDASSEMIYPLLPLFLSSVLGAGAAAIGVIEGIAEGTASLMKVGSGWYSDRLALRRPLVAAGYDVSVICPQGKRHDREPYAELDGVRIYRYPPPPRAQSLAGYVREYPYMLAWTLHLALRVCFGPADSGPHTLVVRLVDPDGHEVIPALQAGFSIEAPTDSDAEDALQMVLEIGNVPFASAGPHAVDILVDGRYEDTVPLRIKKLSA